MLRKKNYKEEDHFTQYHSVVVTRNNGKRVILYFKRYRPKQTSNISVYQTVQNKGKQTTVESEYPVDRTIEVLSFDSDLQFSRAIFKRIGKVRKFISGQSKYQGKDVFFSIVIFKFQYDLVKCFAEEYFQNKINQMVEGTRPKQEQIQEQRKEMIVQHLGNELNQAARLQELYDEGYNPITNKFGQFKVDRQANQKLIQDLPQIKRKKKIEKEMMKKEQKIEE